MKLFQKEIPFIKNQRYMIVLSVLLTLASLVLIFRHSLQFGIDFKGGVKLQYQFNQEMNQSRLQTLLGKAVPENVIVQQFGQVGQNRFVVDVEKPEESAEGIAPRVTAAIQSEVGKEGVTLIKEESVGAKAGAELSQKGQKAILVAWIMILAYIGLRFDFYFSPGAIIALIHDLIITLGAFALTGREISLTVVAAFLTIIGYSVNDTIIVYDRVRENNLKFKTLNLPDLVNRSINETLSRTIITSLTMFFVVMVLFLKGKGEIQDFAFAMIIGVITGTYSSVFIASPVYLFLKKIAPQMGWEKAVGKK